MIWKMSKIPPGFLAYRIKRCRYRKCGKFIIRSNVKKPGLYVYDHEYWYCSKQHYQCEIKIRKIHPDDDPKLLRAAEIALREKLYGLDPLKDFNKIDSFMRSAPYNKTSKKFAPSRHQTRMITSVEAKNRPED